MMKRIFIALAAGSPLLFAADTVFSIFPLATTSFAARVWLFVAYLCSLLLAVGLFLPLLKPQQLQRPVPYVAFMLMLLIWLLFSFNKQAELPWSIIQRSTKLVDAQDERIDKLQRKLIHCYNICTESQPIGCEPEL
jgi:hypothetical protein